MPSKVAKLFTYKKEKALNKLFNDGGHPLINENTISYQGKVEEGERQRSSFPLLSMDDKGSTNLSIHHMYRLQKWSTPRMDRMNIIVL